MADYPTPTPGASTPNPHTPAHASPDPIHVGDLLATLAAISRDELPDGPDRNALAMLIRYGLVDNLYTPMGHAHHTIAWAHRPASVDPRETIAEWLAARREWEHTGVIPALRAALKAALEQGDDGNA